MTKVTKTIIRSVLGAAALAAFVLSAGDPSFAQKKEPKPRPRPSDGGGGVGGDPGVGNGISLNGIAVNGTRANGADASGLVIDFGAVTVTGVTLPVAARASAVE